MGTGGDGWAPYRHQTSGRYLPCSPDRGLVSEPMQRTNIATVTTAQRTEKGLKKPERNWADREGQRRTGRDKVGPGKVSKNTEGLEETKRD